MLYVLAINLRENLKTMCIPWIEIGVQDFFDIHFALEWVQNFSFWVQKMNSIQNVWFLLFTNQILFV